MSHDEVPAVAPLTGPFGWALTVDVEEWYHSCLVPEYVDPARRPPLPQELDGWLAEWPARIAARGVRATFFVLGEIAERWPGRVRALEDLGHEVASHGDLHLRADTLPEREFAERLSAARRRLEDLIAGPVRGYRAPEWSLRRLANPRLRGVAQAGFAYDASLHRAWGVGRPENPAGPSRLVWRDGLQLLEVPPNLASRRWRVPLGGWPIRRRSAAALIEALRRTGADGGCPLLVVHPWELTDRPLPGELMGWSRWVHEAGRRGFAATIEEVLASTPFQPVCEAIPALAALPRVRGRSGAGDTVAAGWNSPASP